MLYNIKFWYEEKYLPTKRHRNERTRAVSDVCKVNIKELTETDFPIAFIVHDLKSVYKDAQNYDDFDGNGDFKMFAEEIRTHKGKLYTPVRVTHGAAISTIFEKLDYIEHRLTPYNPYFEGGKDFTEASIIKADNKAEEVKKIKNQSKEYVIFDGRVWETCGEPMYNITTFGLGHNHGGTGFFITYSYNPNISNKNYFNALERGKAIAYGKRVASNRGDTESINGMGKHDIIEVLMPQMVKRKPQKEHGQGDAF